MTEHRWSKFWWQDWQADQALRTCSLAARGLWMDMLCIAHTGTPRGHVTINGAPVAAKRLAILAGCSEKDCQRLLAELEEAGVFSRTADGVIYSRRMVRDTEHAEMGREAVGRRWAKRDKPNDDPMGEPITPPNRPPSGGPSTLEAEAEAEADKEVESFSLPLVTAREEAAPAPDADPPWNPSAVVATVGVVAAKLEGRHRDTRIAGPASPVRGVDEQLAVLVPKGPKSRPAPPEVLAEARARLMDQARAKREAG